MNIDFNLDDYVSPEFKKPDNMDTIYYLFWERGIGYTEFCKLPIPYILRVLKTHNWVKSEEEKAYKKANKK